MESKPSKEYLYKLLEEDKIGEFLSVGDNEQGHEVLRELLENGQFDIVEKVLRTQLQKEENDPDALSSLANFFVMKGTSCEGEISDKINYWKQGVDYLNRALKINSSHLESLFGKGYALYLLGMVADTLTSNVEDGHVGFGFYGEETQGIDLPFKDIIRDKLNLSDKEETLDEARECLEKVTELDPERVDAWVYLADSYYRLGDKKKAEECKERIISINSSILEDPNYQSILNWDSMEMEISEEKSRLENRIIQDFENAKINIDGDRIRIDDPTGYFSGYWRSSPNKRFIIGYDEGYYYETEEGHDEKVPSLIYLIDSEKGIVWGKEFYKINDYLDSTDVISNDGKVIVHERLSDDEPDGILYVIDNEGAVIFQKELLGYSPTMAISPSGKYAVFDSHHSGLYFIDVDSKEIKWSISSIRKTHPVILDDDKKIVFKDIDGSEISVSLILDFEGNPI